MAEQPSTADAGTEAGLLARLLEVLELDILPLTRAGVERGDKIFGAAVLRKKQGSLVVAATNAETENPLLHGEIATINALYALPSAKRPEPEDCIFLSTHEPCSLCLSAITWAGFDNFYYLFSHRDSRDAFSIPHDLQILEAVFGCAEGRYKHDNAYWSSYSIPELIGEAERSTRLALEVQVDRIKAAYQELSESYQRSKSSTSIPLK